MVTFRLLFFLVLMLHFLPFEASAIYTLSVTQSTGGNTITFGRERGSGTQEAKVNVTITTDVSNRYQVYQLISGPLRRNDGAELDLNNLNFYSLSGTSTLGTLLTTNPVAASRSKYLLYESDGAGSPADFDIIYNLNISENVLPGNYSGSITYIIEPQSNTESARHVTRNVYAYVEPSADMAVSVVPEGGNNFRLGYNALNKDVLVKITSPTESGYQIRQIIDELSSHQMNEKLNYNVKKIKGSGAIRTDAGNLSDSDKIIYIDNMGNEAEIIVSFILKDTDVPSGVYTSNIQYILQPMAAGKKLQKSVSFTIDIEPVLDISVTTETGIGLLNFPDLKPGAEPKITRVNVSINSNTGRPYQVMQIVTGELISSEGHKIPEKHFTVSSENGDIRGKLLLKPETPLHTGETPLLISTKNGDPTNLSLIYKLSIPKNMKAGNYNTQIRYSVSEI